METLHVDQPFASLLFKVGLVCLLRKPKARLLGERLTIKATNVIPSALSVPHEDVVLLSGSWLGFAWWGKDTFLPRRRVLGTAVLAYYGRWVSNLKTDPCSDYDSDWFVLNNVQKLGPNLTMNIDGKECVDNIKHGQRIPMPVFREDLWILGFTDSSLRG